MNHSTSPSPPARTIARRFFVRRLRWGPTWRGWLMLGVASATVVIGLIRCVHPFLALDRPVDADILVVEGWIPEYALRRSVVIAKAGSYKQVLTVGAPVAGVGLPAKDDETYAYVAAKNLHNFGLEPGRLAMVPTTSASRDRTYHCAVDLRRWLNERHLSPRGINVVTLGTHARRSRLVFQKAFGTAVQIGTISIQDEEYDPGCWWRYSEGVKEIISESAAYLYARFFFFLLATDQRTLTRTGHTEGLAKVVGFVGPRDGFQ